MNQSMLQEGEDVRGPRGSGRGPYTVSRGDIERVLLARGLMIAGAWCRSTFLYGDVAALVGLATRGLGRTLDLLTEDCSRRDEPSLAALVVKSASGQVSDGFKGDSGVEREKCYRHWQEHRGVRF